MKNGVLTTKKKEKMKIKKRSKQEKNVLRIRRQMLYCITCDNPEAACTCPKENKKLIEI